ncbi:hypothetical protein LVD17_19130 [Fulvivirga ulvae]|uniref:hypothetical protein n=1 Tax=Fulvivirga ulvae TaxID=2904245 RepID=UPI001F21424B|nr:hypothetical protein [Fulvivirga ulvae]UII30408.1 hypothetical protein LVD17_19130 [Fulvivirga ulvae]
MITEVAANAQTDKEYLKNESFIMGQLVSLSSDYALVSFSDKNNRLGTGDVQGVVIENEIEVHIDNVFSDSLKQGSFVRKFEKMLLGGVIAGGDVNNSDVYPAITVSGGYRFHRFLQFGLATGYEQYDDYENVPVYVYYKGDLSRHSSGVYYYMGAGYSKMWGKSYLETTENDIKGGAVLKAGVGFIFASKSKVDFVTAVGWSRQEIEIEYPLHSTWGGEWKTEVSRIMNRLEFKIGICF